MNENILYDSFKEITHYKGKDLFPLLACILFVCSDMTKGIIRFLFDDYSIRESDITAFQDIIISLLIILTFILTYRYQKRMKTVLGIYCLVFSAILWSYLFHPEYKNWFSHFEYGLNIMIFHMTCAIFGLLVFSLFRDQRKMLTALIIACRLNTFWNVYRYVKYMQRGYWYTYLGDGTLVRTNYNLVFGYSILLCAILFLALYVYNKSIVDLAFFGLSLFLIIAMGSRGPLVCLAAAILLMYYFTWRNTSIRNGRFLLFSILLISSLTGVIVLLPVLVNRLAELFERFNIQSRTIQKYMDGTIFEDSGRDEIHQIAFEMIKENKLFGYGFYGDRYVIGRTWHYGYPHSFVLEVLIQFGVIAGAVIIVVLAYNIVRMVINCREKTWQILFTVFSCANIKLMLSDSFWYYWPFWAFLAVMTLWSHEKPSPFRNRIVIRWRTLRTKR